MRLALFASPLFVVAGCSSPPAAVVTPPAQDAGVDATISQDAGTDAARDASDAGPALPYPLTQQCAPVLDAGAGTCGECNQAKCCNSRAKILPDEVTPLIDCMSDCTTKPAQDECQAGCFAASPAYETAYREQFSCLFHNCQTTCGGGGNPCTTCMEARCARPNMACLLDRSCFLAQTCGGACNGSAACTEACFTKYGTNPKLVEDVVLCGQGFCADVCK